MTALALLGAGVAAPAAAGPISAKHNRTDASFVGMMIVHHSGGVELGRMAVEKGQNAEIRELGRGIVAAQTRELRTLRAMAALFGKKANMPKEVEDRDEIDMERLMAAEGAEFDRMWLDVISAHHAAAIQMARMELQGGLNPHTRRLALAIYKTQRSELASFNRLSEKLG